MKVWKCFGNWKWEQIENVFCLIKLEWISKWRKFLIRSFPIRYVLIELIFWAVFPTRLRLRDNQKKDFSLNFSLTFFFFNCFFSNQYFFLNCERTYKKNSHKQTEWKVSLTSLTQLYAKVFTTCRKQRFHPRDVFPFKRCFQIL